MTGAETGRPRNESSSASSTGQSAPPAQWYSWRIRRGPQNSRCRRILTPAYTSTLRLRFQPRIARASSYIIRLKPLIISDGTALREPCFILGCLDHSGISWRLNSTNTAVFTEVILDALTVIIICIFARTSCLQTCFPPASSYAVHFPFARARGAGSSTNTVNSWIRSWPGVIA